MKIYARMCGWTLAVARVRSGDRVALAAYLGDSAKFDHAIAAIAETYADQNERDHAALQAAVKEGKIQATTGLAVMHAGQASGSSLASSAKDVPIVVSGLLQRPPEVLH